MSNLLKKTGWSKDEIDLFEINEAFAMVTMLAMREHGLDHAKVNVFGGACAQGHPVGSTGSRIILTLINALQKKGGKRGVASLCIGGGEATAVAIEHDHRAILSLIRQLLALTDRHIRLIFVRIVQTM